MALSGIILASLTAYSMLTHDGRRLVSRSDGTNTVFELVPTNRLPAGLPPVREWKIYCIKSTHTDIGLHNPQYMQRAGSISRIEKAVELVDMDQRGDADPAAFRYVMEGYWFWHNYPQDRGEDAARRIVENYVRRGRMDIGVTCAGNHTHLYGEEEIARSAYTAKILREKWGGGTRTMIMADNPGVSWSIVQPYAEAGIENLVFLPNQWNPLPSTIWPMYKSMRGATWSPDAGGGGNRIDVRWASDFPMLFRWQAADGQSEMLFWSAPHYGYGGDAFGFHSHTDSIKDMEKVMPRQIARMDEKYPYDVWLTSQYGDDEVPNDTVARLFAKWNAKWAWPKFITVGRLDEPFARIREKFYDKVPVVRGEITSGWLQHAASTPELLARKFAADRALTVAEGRAAIASADRGVPYPAEDFRRAWWALIQNDEHSYGTSGYEGRRVFETWAQHRDWIEYAERVAGKTGTECPTPCASSRQSNNLNNRTMENRWYKIEVNEQGEITSIWDKELKRELVKGAVNRFLYTRDNHKTWEREPAKALGAELVQKVWLDPDRKLIHIENSFRHARDLFNANRYYRYGYQAFEFAVPDGRYVAQLNGPVIDPYGDMAGLATDAYTAVRDWCAVENDAFGVTLVQFDSSLTEFGEIHPDKTCCSFGKYRGPSSIYSYLFTDWLQMHNPDGDSFNPVFRYAITSYAGGWQDAHLPSVARETVNPGLVELEKRVRAEEGNVRLVSLKAAEDGDGFIARFKESEGRTVKTGIVQTLLKGAKVIPVDMLENPKDAVTGDQFAFAPYAMHAVRISNGRQVAFAPPKDDGFAYTGLITVPRATHGEADGHVYLLWGACMDADFDHYELERAEGDSDVFAFVANVRNEVHDGVAYRCARYEDLGLKSHTRYAYRVRRVFTDGRKGAWSEPVRCLTRQIFVDRFCAEQMERNPKTMTGSVHAAALSPLIVGELPRLEDAKLDTFLTEVYGKRPVERPAEMSFADLYPPDTFERNPAKGPKRKIDAKRRIMICRYKGPFGEDSFRFTVFLPKDAKGPVPAYLLICNRNPGRNIDPWRVEQTGFWPAEEIVDRGYAAIAFWNDEIAPDCYSSDYAFKSGVFRCFEDPSKPRAADAWGTLSAWAWGASRIMDWIETEPAIDAKHVAVVGHSRGGKTALIAGITDRRFAMAVSNGSGCGGAKLYRADLPESEHIHQIRSAVAYWFCGNFAKYEHKDGELPFDQHQWLSLMAPRLLYVASGTLDHWAGPAGEKLAADLARPAWGDRGNEDVGYHIHEGKHDLTSYDWNRFMDFTDAHGWRK